MDDAPHPRHDDRMQLGFYTCSLLLGTLALAACGSGPISLDEGSGETGSDGGDTGDTDEPEDLACADEHGLVPGVLRLEPTLDRAWVIDGGVETPLELTGAGEPEWMLGAAAGDQIAVARIAGPFDDQATIVHAFARGSGELLWTRELAGQGVAQMSMSDDGWLAGTATPQLPGTRVGFVMSEQEAFDLPDHEPIAAPALGHVAAYAVDDLGSRQGIGWVDLDDHSWQPATPAPTDYHVVVGEDHHTLEYLALVEDAPAFVRVRPGEVEAITLPLPQQLEGQTHITITASNGNYRVVLHHDPNQPEDVHVRVDLEGGDAVIVNPEPPPGWSYFDCYFRRVSVDGGGRLYYELRDEASAAPWAYDVEQDTWTQLGHDLGLVDDIDVMAQSQDVMIVRGMAQFQTYCPSTEWAQAPEDALVGDSQQLIRREPALTMVLPLYTWQVLIDRQQRCAASVGENGWEVRALDGSDAVIEVGPGSGQWLWLD
jgi:hypothetical protein